MKAIIEHYGEAIIAAVIGGLIISICIQGNNSILGKIGVLENSVMNREGAVRPVNVDSFEIKARDNEIMLECRTLFTGITYCLKDEVKAIEKKGKMEIVPISLRNSQGERMEVDDEVIFSEAGVYQLIVMINGTTEELTLVVCGKAS